MAKDPACFDENYECVGCCTTGTAKNSALCWDQKFTLPRCCLSTQAPSDTQPATLPPTPVIKPSIGLCVAAAKDASCFNANYNCIDCCTTGKAKDGAPCWGTSEYTHNRCCPRLWRLWHFASLPPPAEQETHAPHTSHSSQTSSSLSQPTHIPPISSFPPIYCSPPPCWMSLPGYMPPIPSHAPSMTPTSSPSFIPTAGPTFVPTQVPTTAPTKCAKDGSCFSERFSCAACCMSGKTLDARPCWDTEYTFERCCAVSASAMPSLMTEFPSRLPTLPPTPDEPSPLWYTSPTAPCARDKSCFDANYDCESCCARDRATNGAPCWDEVYSRSRCCSSFLSSPP